MPLTNEPCLHHWPDDIAVKAQQILATADANAVAGILRVRGLYVRFECALALPSADRQLRDQTDDKNSSATETAKMLVLSVHALRKLEVNYLY